MTTSFESNMRQQVMIRYAFYDTDHNAIFNRVNSIHLKIGEFYPLLTLVI